VGRQGLVKRIELLAASRGHGDGDAQIFTALALAQFDGAGVKGRIKLLGHIGHCVHKAIYPQPHHFDGKLAGVLDEGFLYGRVHEKVIIPLTLIFGGYMGFHVQSWALQD